jgi:hypothetical protein
MLTAKIEAYQALRSQPTPVPTTEGELRVGDEVEWDFDGRVFRGQYHGREPGGHVTVIPNGFKLKGYLSAESIESLRRLPAQPATEGKATGAPVAKVDPYAEHRATLATRLGLWIERDPKALDQHAAYQMRCRDSVRVADTLRDLDRPLTPPRYPSRDRGACLGVMGNGEGVKRREGKGHPSNWPSCGDEEP